MACNNRVPVDIIVDTAAYYDIFDPALADRLRGFCAEGLIIPVDDHGNTVPMPEIPSPQKKAVA